MKNQYKKLVQFLLLIVLTIGVGACGDGYTASDDELIYIRTGSSDYGTSSIVYNFDGKYIRTGSSDYGTSSIVYNFDGRYIRTGSSDYGTSSIVYTIDKK